MSIYKVIKRNGAITTFERLKIEHAIRQAIIASNGDDFTNIPFITNTVIAFVEQEV
jgi:hypothetical protein